MRRVALIIAAFVTAASTAAEAALVLRVEHLQVQPSDADQTVGLDVYFVDLDNSRQRINAFIVLIEGPANTPGGVRFAPPAGLPSIAHPYLFGLDSGYDPDGVVFEYEKVGVAGGGQRPGLEADVTAQRNGLFRVTMLIPGNTPPGHHPAVFNPQYVTFGSLEPLTYMIGPPGGVTVVPEPGAGMAVALGAAAAAVLRRRRWPPP